MVTIFDIQNSIVCKLFTSICEHDQTLERADQAVIHMYECYGDGTYLDISKLTDPESYIMPRVARSEFTFFGTTAHQASLANGSDDNARRAYWSSRLNDSEDPLGPLALDVVDDEFLLGCLANRRFVDRAYLYGANPSTTAVGVSIMREHLASTDAEIRSGGPYVVGILGPRQIADYHHAVFQNLGLPKNTFGGTPRTGDRNEALWLAYSFCPSCDEDH